jgi:hypothetical protein
MDRDNYLFSLTSAWVKKLQKEVVKKTKPTVNGKYPFL